MQSMFQPSFPENTQNEEIVLAVESLIELIKMKEKYDVINRNNQNHQLTSAQLLLTKVAEESCRWVSYTT